MKKILIIITALILLSVTIITLKKQKTETLYKIGILQTASHPALDQACKGFIDELKNQLGYSVEFVIQNAQGSTSNAYTMAQKFHNDPSITALYAIATPAVQACAAVEKVKPIFISAVTDPESLGILHPTTNICGTNDMIDVQSQVAMLTELVPSAQMIAIIYTTGELNSQKLAALLKKELVENNKQVIEYTINSEMDLPVVLEQALHKSDLILAPTDNTIVCAMPFVAQKCLEARKPLIVCDNPSVGQKALACKGVDYYLSGKKTGSIAYDILVKKIQPYEIKITSCPAEHTMINQETLHALGLTIPESLKNTVNFI